MVTTGSPANATRIVFFGTIGSYNAYISGGDVGWDVRVGDEEASVCSKRNLAVFAQSLEETTNFINGAGFSEGAFTVLAEFGIFSNLAGVRIECISIQGVVFEGGREGIGHGLGGVG
jgi:hypothetical protein